MNTKNMKILSLGLVLCFVGVSIIVVSADQTVTIDSEEYLLFDVRTSSAVDQVLPDYSIAYLGDSTFTYETGVSDGSSTPSNYDYNKPSPTRTYNNNCPKSETLQCTCIDYWTCAFTCTETCYNTCRISCGQYFFTCNPGWTCNGLPECLI